MTTPTTPHKNDKQIHLHYLRACLSLAQQSPPKPTNFRVGAILLSRTLSPTTQTYTDTILSTGYTLELPGNTHAEQCALAKYAASHGVAEERIGDVLRPSLLLSPSPPIQSTAKSDNAQPEQKIILYVTMEPCGKRLSGNTPCAARIIQTRSSSQNMSSGVGSDSTDDMRRRRHGINKVYFGVKEPGTFVGGSVGCGMLDEAGVEWEVVEGMEEEILKVATAGHVVEKEKEREAERDAERDAGDGRQGTNIDDISEDERRRQAALPRNPKKRMMETDI
ncbi:hypothetical protein EMCG_02848 [[Emmonsia] crescens]|uniref:CMP/dCMP-type deaminase domain-containing protein n=1 Tax=[Emmonsia] crescens TaxID=73230 RepID=A0A0G2HYC0_9EURO|nr:hypothetical protein EMCG_02848 [Emmonsia crescens UAMH 3008]